MKNIVEEIIQNIKDGLFVNEAAVSQGIIQRILQALDWNVYNPRIVCPEYSLSGGRVDYALCHPIDKPMVFIEVKQIGKLDGAERQLFEYAFHQGVPMAILTDGAEWHFFLPAEQGNYDERRVYKLDLLERDSDEIVNRFQRYLKYQNICNGSAIENARQDYKNIAKEREINNTLPQAMLKLIYDCDEILVDLLKEKVESLCGYSPNEDVVINYLKNNLSIKEIPSTRREEAFQNFSHKSDYKPHNKIQESTTYYTSQNIVGFSLMERKIKTNGARDFCIKGLIELSKLSDNFFSRYASYPKHGKKRRFVSSNKYDLYPGRKDLANNASFEIAPGWWVGTNIGQMQAIKIVSIGCEIAKVKFGAEFKVIYE